MKITKEELNKMIQEELDAYLSETDVENVALEAEDEMEDMPMDDMGAEEPNEELMASLRNLYDVLKGMFEAEEEGEEAEEELDEFEVEEAKKADDDEVEEAKKDDKKEVEESLNESVNRFKKLANIRG